MLQFSPGSPCNRCGYQSRCLRDMVPVSRARREWGKATANAPFSFRSTFVMYSVSLWYSRFRPSRLRISHRFTIVTATSQRKRHLSRHGNLGIEKGTLTNVLISQLMSQSNSLRLMLYTLAVHNGRLELFRDRPMDSVTLRIALNVSARDFLRIWRTRRCAPAGN